MSIQENVPSMCLPATAKMKQTMEHMRLVDSKKRKANWQRWGAYLSERQWGTVREDYSENQEPWFSFPHDHARSRAYRWGEDGLLGICDREGRLCFSFAFWNTHDPILKERLYGLSGPEGNHGEDVKECYYYLDSTPTHSYMKGLYKYPQARFPYEGLTEVNGRRSRQEDEYELLDSGVFENDAYFDCEIDSRRFIGKAYRAQSRNYPCCPACLASTLVPQFLDLGLRPRWLYQQTKNAPPQVRERPERCCAVRPRNAWPF